MSNPRQVKELRSVQDKGRMKSGQVMINIEQSEVEVRFTVKNVNGKQLLNFYILSLPALLAKEVLPQGIL